ncbi:hypothetical protein, partial [Borreliella garinii]
CSSVIFVANTDSIFFFFLLAKKSFTKHIVSQNQTNNSSFSKLTKSTAYTQMGWGIDQITNLI